MTSAMTFFSKLAEADLSEVDRAIAVVWYQGRESAVEMTASQIAEMLHDHNFAKPNISRLDDRLSKSKFVVKGKATRSYKLSATRRGEIDEKFSSLLGSTPRIVRGDLVPPEWALGRASHLGALVHQINGCYEQGFYDACAVIARRMVESLIIEAFIEVGKSSEVRGQSGFIMLDALIKKFVAEKSFHLTRGMKGNLDLIKEIGDRGAHDRKYITDRRDLDANAPKIRKTIRELLDLTAPGS